MIGCWLSVVGCWLSVVGCLVVGYLVFIPAFKNKLQNEATIL